MYLFLGDRRKCRISLLRSSVPIPLEYLSFKDGFWRPRPNRPWERSSSRFCFLAFFFALSFCQAFTNSDSSSLSDRLMSKDRPFPLDFFFTLGRLKSIISNP